MSSAVSFTDIFQNQWKKGCDFVVTVNAYRADYLLWPSFGLKVAAKNYSEEIKQDFAADASEIYHNLPAWISAELLKKEVTADVSAEHATSNCVVILLKKDIAPQLALKLLSWAILKNCDLHIFDCSHESTEFYEKLRTDPQCLGARSTDEFEWMIFSSEAFTSDVLCRSAS